MDLAPAPRPPNTSATSAAPPDPVCGAELFTGNTALLPVAVFEGKATMQQLLKNWVGSYLGNLIGCGIGVVLLLNCGLLPQVSLDLYDFFSTLELAVV